MVEKQKRTSCVERRGFVPHFRLTGKMKAQGIGGNVVAWIEDWLKKIKERVVLKEEASHFVEVTSDVQQGSVVGPVLFFI